MHYEFSTAQRILFGQQSLNQLPGLTAEYGPHVLVLTGKSSRHYDRLAKLLDTRSKHTERLVIPGEPDVELLSQALATWKGRQPDLVIGIGGGSVIDAAKAMAALLANLGDIFDYLEVIGRGKPLTRDPLPCIAIPTTAGTGSEVTRNAVIGSSRHGVKVSMRHPAMLPDIAIVDPELTWSMPPGLTASTGMDALTQCLEAYVTSPSNPLVDPLCREGLRRAARSLRRAYKDGTDLAAREDLSLAALYSGMALANTRLGAVHGIAGPLGGTTGAQHGQICAHLLPIVLRTNLRALREREPDNPALSRFAELGSLLTGKPDAGADAAVTWIEQLCEDLKINNPQSLGLQAAQIPGLVPKCLQSSSMKGNPLTLTAREIEQILQQLTGSPGITCS